MTAPQASSRLEMLQARFQQKQLQEKEQKLLQLYDQQQQRAYQVMQRNSAGSNHSNHGSTAVKTTTTTTTSTSQGGKVRQMFDERRQTKGIDRSYPLEPLENRLRRQTNTNGVATQSRNGNLNRQSVSVKRVARADVNSNVNGGKPVVSYHEEISREMFGPSVRRHDDEDEYIENRVSMYANGHYRHEADNEQEDALDPEMIERNRMMAKIHLMGFDESLKHRVRNDLESEEFPEYLMADMSDKLPKRNVTKRLSQAEARLERFKNANAKRTNMPKQSTSISSTVIRKRSEQTKADSRRSEIAGSSPTSTRSGSRSTERSLRILENARDPAETRAVDETGRAGRRESSDIETFNRRDGPRGFSRNATKADATWRIYPRSNGFKSVTSDGKIFIRRSASPRFFRRESERSGTAMSHDRKSDSSGSPLFYRETLTKRDRSSPFFLHESERSRRTGESRSPVWDGEILSRQSVISPYYLRRETERSETAMSTDRETAESKSSEWSKEISTQRNTIDFDGKLRTSTSLDRKTSPKSPLFEEEIPKRRSTSPRFFCKESERGGTTMSIDAASDDREIVTKRRSPRFFCKETERGGTTMSIDHVTSRSRSPSYDREIVTKRSASPRFFCKESERGGTTMSIDRKISESRSSSYDRKMLTKRIASPQLLSRKTEQGSTRSASFDREYGGSKSSGITRDKRDTSPQFFCKESEKSATTMLIEPSSRSPDLTKGILKQRSYSPDVSYKRSTKSSPSINKRISSAQDRRTPSPSIAKHGVKKTLRENGISSAAKETRRSSKISETSATSTSSVVSLKYGLEFDNIFQSAGLVRRFMKSHDGEQRKVGRSPAKRNVKDANSATARDNQAKNRYKISSLFQKARPPSVESRKRATPESFRKSVTPTEVDVEIQEITMTDHRIERDKPRKATTTMPRRQIDGTYVKRDRTKLKTSITYPARKTDRQRASILESSVSKKSKESEDHRSDRESEECAISLSKLGSLASESSRRIVTRVEKDENRGCETKIPQTREQTWNRPVKDQTESIAVQSRKRENRQRSDSPDQMRDRFAIGRAGSSKTTSADSSRGRRYFGGTISPSLRDSKKQTERTRPRFESLRSARLVRGALRSKNSSPNDEHDRVGPEGKDESVGVDEVDAGIDIKYRTIVETALNRKMKDRHRIVRRNFTERAANKKISLRETTRASSISKRTISPTRDCGRQHDAKLKISPRASPLGKTAKVSRDTPDISPSRKLVSRTDRSSKFFTYTVKDRKHEGALLARRSADSSDRANVKRKIENSGDVAREFSLTRSERESEKDFKRVDSVESTLKRFDSIGAEFERSGPTSFRASSEISLQTMDARSKISAEELKSASEGSTVISPREATYDTILRSTLTSPVGKASKIKDAVRKSDLKIPGKQIRSSSGLAKKSFEDKRRSSTRVLSPTCKRRLFGSDSEKETQEERTKARRKENYSSVRSKFRKDQAVSRVGSPKAPGREITKASSEETFSVKPLRSIEDIRKSIDNERSRLFTANESRSAIANRRAADAARNVFRGGDPARLIKIKSCVFRSTKSPSPDPRKQHEMNARATRRSAPSSPSKSPDIVLRRASTESRNQETRSSRKPAVARGADSIGNKTAGAVDTIDGVVLQNGSPQNESATKRSDAFVIDDRPSREDDAIPTKKSSTKRYTDKQQTASSASGRPTSSVSSNSSAGLTQGQVSSAKGRMAAKARMPGGPRPKGSPPKCTMSEPSGAVEGLATCNICRRSFAPDRIAYHEKICAKHGPRKKRKPFDTVMFRVRGTELEPFVKKEPTKKQESKTKNPQSKSNWRRQHEDFINAIRSAKQMQAHLAAGGNLRDLPPPPPSDTSDYIQCPHCGRKFNQAAAARHIPKCEHMLHNKPAHARAPRR